jgi:hypothetical protein
VRPIGYVFFLLAFILYGTIWQAIGRLVKESRQIEPGRHFSRFWWLLAWKAHKSGYPISDVRQQIVVRFILTFASLSVATACIGYSMFHNKF